MVAEWGRPITYALPLSAAMVPLNSLIGGHIELIFSGEIFCYACGRATKKSFAQGLCYPCFKTAPEASECIIRPELCRGHLGEGRDPDWETRHHVQEHIVYLALSSAVKVGVTRIDQVPTRWIDQGASRTIELARTPNRYLAGCIEVALKEHVGDRTNWRRMLKNEIPEGEDLVARKQELLAGLSEELRVHVSRSDRVLTLTYPVQNFPEKVTSVSFDKSAEISGDLAGIKGQYLIFTDNRVLNIRKHTGYTIELRA